MNEILRLIATREEDFPDHLLKAQKHLLRRLDTSENDSEALTLLAEINYWLGIHEADDARKEECLGQGVAYGMQAATLVPDSVAANFWYADCMAAHSVVRGMMNSLSYFQPMEKHGNRALELDEMYFNAAPLRMMGRFYCKVPPSPVGPGDKKKGLELSKRAVDLAPDTLYNRVVLADAYLSARYFEEARVLLMEVLKTPEPAAFRMSHALYVAEARQILERLEAME